MNRRGFLGLLAPAAAVLAAPALLIPRRTFFLPPAGGWHGTTLTATDIRRAQQYMRDADEAMQRSLMRDMDKLINPPVMLVDGKFRHYEGFNFLTTDRYGHIVPYVMNG